jgi:hypothetical protein
MRVKNLALAFTVIVAPTLLSSSDAGAVEYPWCARYGGAMRGASNCGFVSFEQCMDTVRGIGGFCEVNPFYPGPRKPAARKRKRTPR